MVHGRHRAVRNSLCLLFGSLFFVGLRSYSWSSPKGKWHFERITVAVRAPKKNCRICLCTQLLRKKFLFSAYHRIVKENSFYKMIDVVTHGGKRKKKQVNGFPVAKFEPHGIFEHKGRGIFLEWRNYTLYNYMSATKQLFRCKTWKRRGRKTKK